MQPVGPVPQSALDCIRDCAAGQYGFETSVRDPWPIPGNIYDPRRRQHSSFELLQLIARNGAAGADRVLGVADCDLFIPALTFVFGQAQLDGTFALVALARLRQDFYGLPSDNDLFRLRLRKETVHELGHTCGLIHCSGAVCAMRLSTNILHVDAKEDRLCVACEEAARDYMARWRRNRQ